jgi:hypothetical protein
MSYAQMLEDANQTAEMRENQPEKVMRRFFSP